MGTPIITPFAFDAGMSEMRARDRSGAAPATGSAATRPEIVIPGWRVIDTPARFAPFTETSAWPQSCGPPPPGGTPRPAATLALAPLPPGAVARAVIVYWPGAMPA